MASLLSLFKRPLLVFWRAICLYVETDGEQRAASFAYYALFALFPLIIVFVSIGSLFVDQAKATSAIVDYIGTYMPVGPDGQNVVNDTIRGVIKARRGVGIMAGLAVFWSSLGFFHALVRGVNKAWGTQEYPWYKMPLKSLNVLGIMGSALLLGIIAPLVMDSVWAFMSKQGIPFGWEMVVYAFDMARLMIPITVLFYGLSMFYMFAPRGRRPFADVWIASVIVTALLGLVRKLLMLYLSHFNNFNKVYGTLGGVVVLLLWIYLSGTLIIFGGCLCAAGADRKAEAAS
jgi:YihY family inner membrane protein